MSTSQAPLELTEEKKLGDQKAQKETKSKLQSFREHEKTSLQSISKLTEEEMDSIDQWLLVLYKMYEELEYPPPHRVYQATTYFNDELQSWYEQIKNEINNDWSCFCNRLKKIYSGASEDSN